nr:E3 ubiquitin-protein ligase SHPRH isoform X1 [Tanacetum cinerariifolium]
VYEARLFRLNKGHDGGVITSAEEAVNIQKRKSALNRFYWTLSRREKASQSSSVNDEDDGTKRGVGEKVMVSKSPSELEVVLGILKSYSKVQLDREVTSAAKKHLFLLEGMRKEYAHARSLAVAQAQVLNAHDELKMATSRLRLRENEDDKSIDALSLDELEQASVENSSEKFLALSTLTRIKGQLRYLKGLVDSKQHSQSEGERDPSGSHIMRHDRSNLIRKEDNENRFLGMTERWKNLHGKSHNKWVMCPTCRQHTEYGNVAFVDDMQNKSPDASVSTFRSSEASVTVKGSYSTKISAAETNSVQVLLILIQHGANGLNLLEAQHVILVEPLLNPAAEAQAISRVHRIGQTQKTLIHRFIAKDTVEESLYKLNKSRHSGSFISGNKKNQDQPVLTIKDVESLFKVVPSTIEEKKEEATSDLIHLPPGVAAGIAAERRLMEQTR